MFVIISAHFPAMFIADSDTGFQEFQNKRFWFSFVTGSIVLIVHLLSDLWIMKRVLEHFYALWKIKTSVKWI